MIREAPRFAEKVKHVWTLSETFGGTCFTDDRLRARGEMAAASPRPSCPQDTGTNINMMAKCPVPLTAAFQGAELPRSPRRLLVSNASLVSGQQHVAAVGANVVLCSSQTLLTSPHDSTSSEESTKTV
jgi:hypothetical protein